MDRARLRSGPSAKVVVMMDRPAGAVKAALRPLMKRLAISSGPESTSPPSSEASANTPRAIRKTWRLPSRSAVRPPSRSRPPYPRM